MDRDELKQRCLEALEGQAKADSEVAHIEADEIILQYLRDIGEHEVADRYEWLQDKVTFWYA